MAHHLKEIFIITYFKLRVNQNCAQRGLHNVLIITYFKLRVNQNKHLISIGRSEL